MCNFCWLLLLNMFTKILEYIVDLQRCVSGVQHSDVVKHTCVVIILSEDFPNRL